RDGGCAQRFQGGSIYWSPASGAHQSWGLIRDYWAGNGWETGRFGYPVWDEQCAPNGDAWECRQSYQGGVITYNSRTGMRG
ncbi:LGFP repeat-containing protein, partial [Enemella evansiae]